MSATLEPAPGATPVPAPSDGRHRPPFAVSFLDRRSIVGASVVLGIALLYVLVIPIAADVLGDPDFSPGEPFVVSDSVQVVPADGWSLDPSSNMLFTTLTKSGVNLIVTGAVPSEQPIDEQIQVQIDAYANDPEHHWIVGEPQAFTTDVGEQGVSVTAHGTSQAAQSWIISDGEHDVTLLATSPDAVWASVQDDLTAMVESVQFVQPQDTP